MKREAVEKFFEMVDVMIPDWEGHFTCDCVSTFEQFVKKHIASRSELTSSICEEYGEYGYLVFQWRNEARFWMDTYIIPFKANGWETYARTFAMTSITHELTIDANTGEIVSMFTPEIGQFIEIIEKLDNQELLQQAKGVFLKGERK